MRLVAIFSLVGLVIFSGCRSECIALSPERIDTGAFQSLLGRVSVCSDPGLVVEKIEVWPSIGGGVRKEGTTPSQPYRSLRLALTVRNEGEAADLRINYQFANKETEQVVQQLAVDGHVDADTTETIVSMGFGVPLGLHDVVVTVARVSD